MAKKFGLHEIFCDKCNTKLWVYSGDIRTAPNEEYFLCPACRHHIPVELFNFDEKE